METSIKRLVYFLDVGHLQDNHFITLIKSQKISLQEFATVKDLLAAINVLEPTAIIIHSCDMLTSEEAIKLKDTVNSSLIIVCDQDSVRARLFAARLRAHAYFTVPVDSNNLLNVLDNLDYIKDQSKGNILLVGADWERIKLHCRALIGEHINIFQVMTASAALDHVINNPCDLIICDVKLAGDFTAIDLAIAVRNLDQFHKIPIIMLADSLNQEDRAQSMAIENLYVLPRYVNYQNLAHAIRNSILQWRSSQHTILTDPLTGLYTRVPTIRLVEVQLNQLQWSPKPFTLMIIGLEKRSRVISDQDIVKFLNQLRHQIGGEHYIGQLTRGVFLVIMPGIDQTTARQFINQFKLIKDQLIEECHVGIVGRNSNETTSDLITLAEETLQQARQQGSGSIVEREPNKKFD